MPELPEVEQAAKLARTTGQGKIIEDIKCTEDALVFDGITCEEFSNELRGRRLLDAKRYGKYFYLELEGDGRMPVLHLGMTGYLQTKGTPAHQYAVKKKADPNAWPPKFVKFVMIFAASISGEEVRELAFSDARRLGRVRLRSNPLTQPPIASLGFDPLLSMPPKDKYTNQVLRRKCPIKALLLDQSFNAGVGNWVADEILFHSGIHPERRCHTLNLEDVEKLYANTTYVCQTAVDLNADSASFPSHWLFKHRWGKGKKNGNTVLLSNGEKAEISWTTVGGRTSAFAIAVQPLNQSTSRNKRKRKLETSGQDDGMSSLTELSDSDAEQLES